MTASVNLDALTYAGNLDALSALARNDGHVFVQGDIVAANWWRAC